MATVPGIIAISSDSGVFGPFLGYVNTIFNSDGIQKLQQIIPRANILDLASGPPKIFTPYSAATDNLQVAQPARHSHFTQMALALVERVFLQENVAFIKRNGDGPIIGGTGPRWDKQYASEHYADLQSDLADAKTALTGVSDTWDTRLIVIHHGDTELGDPVATQIANLKKFVGDLRGDFVEGPTHGSNVNGCPVALIKLHPLSHNTASKIGQVDNFNHACDAVARDLPNVVAISLAFGDPFGIPNGVGGEAGQYVGPVWVTWYDSRELANTLVDVIDKVPGTLQETLGLAPTYLYFGERQVNGDSQAASIVPLTGDPDHLAPDPLVQIWNENNQAWEDYDPQANAAANGGPTGMNNGNTFNVVGPNLTLVKELKKRHPGQVVHLFQYGVPESSLGLTAGTVVISAATDVTITAATRTISKAAGTWTVTPTPGQFIRLDGTQNAQNQGYKVVESATSNTIVVYDTDMIDETPAAVTITQRSGTWKPNEGNLFAAMRAQADIAYAEMIKLGTLPDFMAAIYHQGESDTLDAGLTGRYQANLEELIDALQGTFGTRVDSLAPVVVVQLPTNQTLDTDRVATVRAAQAAAAANRTGAALVTYDDPVLRANGLDLTYQSYEEIGRRIKVGVDQVAPKSLGAQ